MPVRVSVVVAVHNPREHLERLIESLTAQTLPSAEFEAVFVEGGSTDGTPVQLDQLARERNNIVVLHEPDAGRPAGLRNRGTDAASGEYVLYVDSDDWLGAEALERMTAAAGGNHADIVIGRYAGPRRSVAEELFRETREAATLADTPLMDSLTPHKMFRTAFLREHELRFPEGRGDLEDQVFVTTAYFLSRRTCVLADYHCYFHVRRDDAADSGPRRVNPSGYAASVRQVLDVVHAHTEPGSLRDRCLGRSMRVELLGRLDERGLLEQGNDDGRQLFRELRQLAADYVPVSVDARLAPPYRVRAALLRQDRPDDLSSYLAHDRRRRATARLVELHWDDEGRLLLGAEASFVEAGTGYPWSYDVDGERALLQVPNALRSSVGVEALDCTAGLASARLELVLRRREDSEEWLIPTDHSVKEGGGARHGNEGRLWLTHRSRACLDPRTLGGGRPLIPGFWDVYARVSQSGWSKDVRLGSDRTDVEQGRRPALLSGGLVRPYWTHPYGNLSLEVGGSPAHVLAELAVGTAPLPPRRGWGRPPQLRLHLPFVVHPHRELQGQLCLIERRTAAILPCRLRMAVDANTLQLTAELPRRRRLRGRGLAAGAWDIALHLPSLGTREPVRSRLVLRVPDRGPMLVQTAAEARAQGTGPSQVENARVAVRRALRTARRLWRQRAAGLIGAGGRR